MQIDQNEIRRDFMKLREHIASAGINYSSSAPYFDIRIDGIKEN